MIEATITIMTLLFNVHESQAAIFVWLLMGAMVIYAIACVIGKAISRSDAYYKKY